MTDTIELLEAIGSDASLRYASASELKGVLEQARANTELTEAAASGDGALLRVELGIQGVPQTHSAPPLPNEDDEEEETDIPQPEPRSPGRPSPVPAKETQ